MFPYIDIDMKYTKFKQIVVSQGNYEALKQIKENPNDSFNDIISELVRGKCRFLFYSPRIKHKIKNTTTSEEEGKLYWERARKIINKELNSFGNPELIDYRFIWQYKDQILDLIRKQDGIVNEDSWAAAVLSKWFLVDKIPEQISEELRDMINDNYNTDWSYCFIERK